MTRKKLVRIRRLWNRNRRYKDPFFGRPAHWDLERWRALKRIHREMREDFSRVATAFNALGN